MYEVWTLPFALWHNSFSNMFLESFANADSISTGRMDNGTKSFGVRKHGYTRPAYSSVDYMGRLERK